MMVKNQTKNVILVTHGTIADTFLTRLKGLLGSAPLQSGQGLLLKNEKSIHTFFMTFAIDVVYINKENTIISLNHAIPPNKIGGYVPQSAAILELPAGTLKQTNTTRGDSLSIEV